MEESGNRHVNKEREVKKKEKKLVLENKFFNQRRKQFRLVTAALSTSTIADLQEAEQTQQLHFNFYLYFFICIYSISVSNVYIYADI